MAAAGRNIFQAWPLENQQIVRTVSNVNDAQLFNAIAFFNQHKKSPQRRCETTLKAGVVCQKLIIDNVPQGMVIETLSYLLHQIDNDSDPYDLIPRMTVLQALFDKQGHASPFTIARISNFHITQNLRITSPAHTHR